MSYESQESLTYQPLPIISNATKDLLLRSIGVIDKSPKEWESSGEKYTKILEKLAGSGESRQNELKLRQEFVAEAMSSLVSSNPALAEVMLQKLNEKYKVKLIGADRLNDLLAGVAVTLLAYDSEVPGLISNLSNLDEEDISVMDNLIETDVFGTFELTKMSVLEQAIKLKSNYHIPDINLNVCVDHFSHGMYPQEANKGAVIMHKFLSRLWPKLNPQSQQLT